MPFTQEEIDQITRICARQLSKSVVEPLMLIQQMATDALASVDEIADLVPSSVLLGINPESLAIRKQMYTRMSERAQFVAGLILDCSQEVWSEFENHHGTFSKGLLSEYLANEFGWPPQQVDEVLTELKDYVRAIA